jgi:hypothetical protein
MLLPAGDNGPVPRVPAVAAALATVTSVSGTLLVVVAETPYAASSAALVSAGLLLLTVVGVAGIVLARGRWARRLLMACTGAWLAVAAVSPPSPLWGSLVVAAAASLGFLAGPWLDRWLRRLPSARGPSPTVTLLLISLTAAPAAVGLASPAGAHAGSIAWSAWSLALALALGKALPGSLSAVRLANPILALGAGIVAGLPGGLAAPAAAVAPTALAWRREVRVAVVPTAPTRSEPVPFPPELVAPDVLSAAGLDARGARTREAE